MRAKADKVSVSGISGGSQPLVLWHNAKQANLHRRFAGELRTLTAGVKDDEVVKMLAYDEADKEQMRASLERFCDVFPDAFAVTDRGPYFDPNAANKGRPLTAGFHLMRGHFRDDVPLQQMILTDAQRRELDALWHGLDFVTLSPMRQYKDFIFFERAEPPRFMREAEFDFARSEDKDAVSEQKMARLAKAYLAKAIKNGAKAEAQKAIESYFASMSESVRRVERDRLAAEPSHLEALTTFAQKAYRRPLSAAERDDLLAFYRTLRKGDELSHEEAMRDVIVSVLMSPHFCYRFDLAPEGESTQRISGHALANRLSYFLWASMPDAELLAHAKAGDLHKPRGARRPKPGACCERRPHSRPRHRVRRQLARFPSLRGAQRRRPRSLSRLSTNDLRRGHVRRARPQFLVDAAQQRSLRTRPIGVRQSYLRQRADSRETLRHDGTPKGGPERVATHRRRPPLRPRRPCCPWRCFSRKQRARPAHQPGETRLLGGPPRARRTRFPPRRPTVPELPSDEAKTRRANAARSCSPITGPTKACAGCHRTLRFRWPGVRRLSAPSANAARRDLGDRAGPDARANVPRRRRKASGTSMGLRAYLQRAAARTISSTTFAASSFAFGSGSHPDLPQRSDGLIDDDEGRSLNGEGLPLRQSMVDDDR